MSGPSPRVPRLDDARARRVVFLSHCLANENVRYPGGAFRPACVDEVLRRCTEQGIGIVQMPCPEQRAWGGVRKTTMVSTWCHPLFARPLVARVATALFLAHTRRVYRALARSIAADVADWTRSGFEVVGIVGIDASPSCGVRTTIEPRRALPLLASLPRSASAAEVNDVIRRVTTEGSGLFIAALEHELARRGLRVPFLSHDLLEEMAGRPSGVTFA